MTDQRKLQYLFNIVSVSRILFIYLFIDIFFLFHCCCFFFLSMPNCEKRSPMTYIHQDRLFYLEVDAVPSTSLRFSVKILVKTGYMDVQACLNFIPLSACPGALALLLYYCEMYLFIYSRAHARACVCVCVCVLYFMSFIIYRCHFTSKYSFKIFA